MVKALHAAGLEVILDVVYNHTGEGGHDGPTLSLRGLDNQAYYRLRPDDPSRYLDYTGTGNSLNMLEPHVLQLIMDSLRYWIEEMHVDGFRFDLASALARELHAVDRLSAFFDIIQQDPVIRTVKLIAEPWDVGEGGYQVGNFPAHWAEWNGRYRDTVRDLWRGQPDMLHDFGRRFTGSADLYQDDGRRPSASINLVTAHDGFTLADLVSYDRKHNRANGDGDRDGESHNRSWNCGAEGATERPRHPGPARAASSATCWPRCSCRRACPCSSAATSWVGRSRATTTPTATTRSSPGSTGMPWTSRSSTSRADSSPCGGPTPSSGAAAGSWRATLPGAASAAPDIEWRHPRGTRMRDEEWHADAPAAIAVYLSGRHLVDAEGLPVERRLLLPVPQRRTRRPDLPTARRGARQAGQRVLDTAAAQPFGPWDEALPAGGRPGSSCATGPSWCCCGPRLTGRTWRRAVSGAARGGIILAAVRSRQEVERDGERGQRA